MMMMPVFPGAPWVPKFGGQESDLKYEDWKEQLQGLVQYAGQTESQKVGVLMGALTGTAKRQVNILALDQRDTTAKIFTALDAIYKARVAASALRAQFYGCRQKPDESARFYILRLRELHCGLQQHNEDEAPTDEHLKEQFLLGLEEGPLTQTLRRYARQHPDDTFDALQQEAILLEEDGCGRKWQEASCTAVGGANNLSSRTQKTDWKVELKQEIMSELKDQLKEWTQELIREFRPMGPVGQSSHPPRPEPARHRVAPASSNMWAADGKPICRRCHEIGHIARFCKNPSQATPPLN